MSCSKPLKGFVVGMTKDLKPKLMVLPNDVKYLDSRNVPHYTDDAHEEDNTSYYELPCGHCLGCRTDQSREWANRLEMEMMYHRNSYFVTLTYDNQHIPHGCDVLPENGSDRLYSLSVRDVQLFIKRLRKQFPNDGIRYYFAGEYGPNTGRPHYHGILFCPDFGDLKPYGRSETGNQYYVSETLRNLWPLGFTSIEPANWQTCQYVAAYVTKKLGIKPNKHYYDLGIIPPFSTQSRKPGIGARFYEDHKDSILQNNKIYLSSPKGAKEFPIPRYFIKKLNDDFPDEMIGRTITLNRSFADMKDSIEERTNLSFDKYREQKGEVYEQQFKGRKRNKL